MTLLDIMPVLTDNYLIKIGLEGDYIGTFNKGDIQYRLLKMTVVGVYPFVVINKESEIKEYIAVDLVDKEGRK